MMLAPPLSGALKSHAMRHAPDVLVFDGGRKSVEAPEIIVAIILKVFALERGAIDKLKPAHNGARAISSRKTRAGPERVSAFCESLWGQGLSLPVLFFDE